MYEIWLTHLFHYGFQGPINDLAFQLEEEISKTNAEIQKITQQVIKIFCIVFCPYLYSKRLTLCVSRVLLNLQIQILK